MKPFCLSEILSSSLIFLSRLGLYMPYIYPARAEIPIRKITNPIH